MRPVLLGRVAFDVGHPGSVDLAFAATLALAAVGSAVVFALAVAALLRRRSRSYLLVALALSTLLARTAVAVLSATGRLGPDLHHVLEHGLDVTMAGLVIAAVYDARSARKSTHESAQGEPTAESTSGGSTLEPDGGAPDPEPDGGAPDPESDGSETGLELDGSDPASEPESNDSDGSENW